MNSKLAVVTGAGRVVVAAITKNLFLINLIIYNS